MRSMGKAAFMNIQDEFDKIQIYIKNDIVGISNYNKIVKKLDIGDIIVSMENYLELERTNYRLILLV